MKPESSRGGWSAKRRVRRRIIRLGRFFVYLLRCVDGSLYAGYTVDLEERLAVHNSGRGAKYLRGRGPGRIVYVKKYRYLRCALRAEYRLKHLPKFRKEDLIRRYNRRQVDRSR